MEYSDEQKTLINQVYLLFTGHMTCTNTWGIYLFTDEFNHEQELKNKLGMIWISSLYDAIEAEKRHFDSMKQKSINLNLPHLLRYFDQISVLFHSIKNIISKFTVSEQIFILDSRNQYVHAYLNGFLQSKRRVKYLENNILVDKELTSEEYFKLANDFDMNQNLDITMANLLKRIDHINDQYFLHLGELQRSSNIMYQAMLSGSHLYFAQ